MSKDEIRIEFEEFLNEHGLFIRFETWIKERGYELSDLGMEE